MKKFSAGKITLGCVIALALGLFGTQLGIASGLVVPIWFTLPVLIMLMFGFAGYLPAIVLAATALAGAFSALGAIWALVALAACALPAASVLALSIRRMPFFKQLRAALISLSAGAVLALVALMLAHGTNLVGVAADALRARISNIDAETIAGLEANVTELLSRFGLRVDSAAGGMLTELVDLFEQVAKIYAPSVLALYIALNATLSVLCVNYMRTRRGDDGVEYVAPNEWSLPASSVWGLLCAFIVSWITSYMGRAEMVLAHYTIRFCVSFAAIVQALCSVLRRLKKSGMTKGKRTAIIVFLILLAQPFLVIYGILSALIGSRGALTPRIKAYIDKKQKGE